MVGVAVHDIVLAVAITMKMMTKMDMVLVIKM